MRKSKVDRIRLANEEIFAKGNLDAVADFFAAEYVAHAGRADYTGHAFIRRWTKQLRTAIPDLRVVDVAPLTQSGDTITWQRTLTGTHKATLKGIPPSGKRVTWTDMHVTRFIDGKIAEEWTVSDLAGHLMAKLRRT